MSQTNDAAGGIKRWKYSDILGADDEIYNAEFVLYDDHMMAMSELRSALSDVMEHYENSIDEDEIQPDWYWAAKDHLNQPSPPQAAPVDEFEIHGYKLANHDGRLWLFSPAGDGFEISADLLETIFKRYM